MFGRAHRFLVEWHFGNSVQYFLLYVMFYVCSRNILILFSICLLTFLLTCLLSIPWGPSTCYTKVNMCNAYCYKLRFIAFNIFIISSNVLSIECWVLLTLFWQLFYVLTNEWIINYQITLRRIQTASGKYIHIFVGLKSWSQTTK